jgi:hypothetical protein
MFRDSEKEEGMGRAWKQTGTKTEHKQGRGQFQCGRQQKCANRNKCVQDQFPSAFRKHAPNYIDYSKRFFFICRISTLTFIYNTRHSLWFIFISRLKCLKRTSNAS